MNSKISTLSRSLKIRFWLILLELYSLCIVVVIVFLDLPFILSLVMLSIRSVSFTFSRTFSYTLIKKRYDTDTCKVLLPKFGMARYIGAGLSGLVIGVPFFGVVSKLVSFGILIFAGLISLVCIVYLSRRYLPSWNNETRYNDWQQLKMIFQDPILSSTACLYLLISMYFHGLHNVSRIIFPIGIMKMGEVGVMMVQFASGIAAFIGAFIIIKINKYPISTLKIRPLAILATIAVAVMMGSFGKASGYWFYFVFLVFGTYLSLDLENELVLRSKKSLIEEVSTTMQNLQLVAILFSILLFGVLTEQFSFHGAVYITSILALILLIFVRKFQIRGT